MKQIKIIATDLDGTLLNNKGVLTDRTKNAIIKVRQKGIHFIPVSGRPINSIRTIFDKMPISCIVCNNGATVYSIEKEKLLFSATIELNICFSIIKRYSSVIEKHTFCSNYVYYMSGEKEWNAYGQPMQTCASFKKNKIDIVKLELFFKERVDLASIKKDIETHYPMLSVIVMCSSYNDVYWIEVMQKDINKGKSLEQVAKLLSLDLSNTVSFGDGFNDVSMLEVSGLGVAMGNAVQEVKNVADEIAFSNEDDGVAVWLKSYYAL